MLSALPRTLTTFVVVGVLLPLGAAARHHQTSPAAPTITGEPTNPTISTMATFTFTDSQAGVSFLCSLDGAAYVACGSGISYSSLSGTNTFAVEAEDTSGNISVPTTYSWTVTAPPPPPGSVFYVSSTGSDANPGTVSAPWLTIQHAANTVGPGNTVNVAAGVYNGIVNINVSGNATAGPIVFQASQNAVAGSSQNAIVDGTGLVPSTAAAAQGLFNITGQSYITIQGFEIRNFQTSNAHATPAGVWVTGSGSNIQIMNNLVHNIVTTSEKNGNAFGIAVYGTSTTPITNLTIGGNQVYDLKTGNSESVNVDGNVPNFVISGNVVHDNDNIGIDAIGFEGVAPNSTVDYARNGVISGNTVYNITAINNPGEGDQYDADGIYCDGCSQVIIEQNLVYNCDLNIEAASEHSGHTSNYVTIRSNVVYNANSVGISIGGYASSVGGTDHVTIVNNTLFDDDAKNTGSGEFQVQYSATNNVFENNIVYATSQGLFVNNFTKSVASPVALNYNLYFSSLSASAARFVWNGQSLAGIAAYQSASGQDANTSYANPVFDSTGSPPNLDIQPGSPAIGAGFNLGPTVEGPDDFAGNPWPATGPINIGAYEQ